MSTNPPLQDPAVFETVFRQYHVALCRYARRFVPDMPTAEEIVQELFLHLWEQAPALRITTSLESYLYRAVKNRCLNYLQSKWARAGGQEEVPESADLWKNPVEEQLAQRELLALVQEGMNQLPEKTRIVFALSRQGGLSYAEIASQLGVSVKTVEAQVSAALKSLKSFLQRRDIQLLLTGLLTCGTLIFFFGSLRVAAAADCPTRRTRALRVSRLCQLPLISPC